MSNESHLTHFSCYSLPVTSYLKGVVYRRLLAHFVGDVLQECSLPMMANLWWDSGWNEVQYRVLRFAIFRQDPRFVRKRCGEYQQARKISVLSILQFHRRAFQD